MAHGTKLDQPLLQKIAEKTNKSTQYIREQISRRASRLGIAAEAAQILWAKELGIGTAVALRRLEPHEQEQVRASLPAVFSGPTTAQKGRKGSSRTAVRNLDPIRLAVDYLIEDEELKSRCGDLLKAKRHFDRALREATVVLDDRLKKLTGITNMNPENLVGKALNPNPNKAVIVVSKEPAEQKGFHGICNGLMLAFRNPAHHKLDDKFSQRDALRLCAFVDAVLAILQKADVHLDRV